MPSGGKLRIYDDGRCAFCQWTQSVMERHDRDQRLEFRDFNLPEHAAETPVPFAQLSRRMHVQTPDAAWHSGFPAWLEILKVLPRLHWLGRLFSLPPCCWLGPFAYQFVADHRYRVPRFFLRWVGAPPPCDAACALPEAPSRKSG